MTLPDPSQILDDIARNEMSTTQQRNAAAVVASWARSEHHEAWGEAAHGEPPSALMQQGAFAFAEVARAAYANANNLIKRHGYLADHVVIKQLRKTGDEAGQRSQNLETWALCLQEAEDEVDL